MWTTVGTDTPLPIQFLLDDDYVVPSTASLRVVDIRGAEILPPEPLVTTETSLVYTLPGALLTLPAGQDFNTLFAEVTFVAQGRLQRDRTAINVIPFVPMTATPHDVRLKLGVSPTELMDHEIDLLHAWMVLKSEEGQTFEDALISGTISALRANRLIVVETALQLLPALPAKIGQKLKAEDQEFSRFNNLDWGLLAEQLERERAELLNDLTATNPNEVPTRTIGVWANPTDPITGG